MSQLTRLSTSTYVKKTIHTFDNDGYNILKNEITFGETDTGNYD